MVALLNLLIVVFGLLIMIAIGAIVMSVMIGNRLFRKIKRWILR